MMLLSEPTGTQPLLNAVRWAEGVLLGSTAVVVATLAIATLGFLMLSGRVQFRRGSVAIIGCFMLFGATTLARGVIGLMFAERAEEARTFTEATNVPPPLGPPPPAQPQVYDPYAGAAVPVR